MAPNIPSLSDNSIFNQKEFETLTKFVEKKLDEQKASLKLDFEKKLDEQKASLKLDFEKKLDEQKASLKLNFENIIKSLENKIDQRDYNLLLLILSSI